MTPPNVLGAAKPTSSVIMSRIFGAFLGGTMCGAHHALDCGAFLLITPPNLGSGAGSCRPSMVVVALGEPAVPMTVAPAVGAVVGSAARDPLRSPEPLD